MTADAGPALKKLHEQFQDQVEFVTLYVREAHPGENYPQPDSMEQKIRHARDYKRRDGIPWTVAVDDLDGTLHLLLDPKPSSAYLINRDGVVVYRQLWSNDYRLLRFALERLTQRPDQPIGQRENMVLPMLGGLGVMRDVVHQAGSVAERDLFVGLPPIYLLSQLASVFKPLSSRGRALAAIGACTLGTVAVSWIGWKIFKR